MGKIISIILFCSFIFFGLNAFLYIFNATNYLFGLEIIVYDNLIINYIFLFLLFIFLEGIILLIFNRLFYLINQPIYYFIFSLINCIIFFFIEIIIVKNSKFNEINNILSMILVIFLQHIHFIIQFIIRL